MPFDRKRKELVYGTLRTIFLSLPLPKSFIDSIKIPAKRFLARLMQINYEKWVELFDSLSDQDRVAICEHMSTWPKTPVFSVMMIVPPNVLPISLDNSIESIRSQLYPHWECFILKEPNFSPDFNRREEDSAQNDPRMKISRMDPGESTTSALNKALGNSRGDYFVMLDPGDELSEHAFYWIASVIATNPEVALVYSDEDSKISRKHRSYPWFKPDWNPDLFLSQNMISRVCALRTARARELGGFRSDFDACREYDLGLRFIEGLSEDQINHIPAVLYHRGKKRNASKDSVGDEEKKASAMAAVTDCFKRNGIEASVETVPGYPTGRRIRYRLPEILPLVSIVIPTRDGCNVLKYCIESIYSVTRYRNFEIIVVDNQSSDPDTLSYLESIELQRRARVLRYPHPFNYSAINNLAVSHCKGSVVCLLNNDTEMVAPEWLEEMVSHALRPGIGAVGAKLLYPNGLVQHAGVIMGIAGMVGHAFHFLRKDEAGYWGRAILVQNLTAVTGACIVVQKKHYDAVGGMESEHLKVTFNDIDLCLRLNSAGYRNLWTPFAEVVHHESLTRGRDQTIEQKKRAESELSYMRLRWGLSMEVDPAYNPNLSIDELIETFQLAWPPRTDKPWATFLRASDIGPERMTNGHPVL